MGSWHVSMQSPPPGWYPDPQGPAGLLRYWDGGQWTEHRHVVGPAAPPQPVTRSSSKGWVGWVVAGVVAIAAIGALADDDSEPASQGSSSSSSADDEPASDAGSDGDAAADEVPPDDAAAPAVVAPPKPKTYKVASVTDGDTLRLANGEAVRLVGMDAPEMGQCGSERATALLTQLVDRQRVTLAAPVDDRDRYGRLLRYVNIGTMDAGLRLIKSGLAIARYDSRDGYDAHPRQDLYHRADDAKPDVKCGPARPVPLAGGQGSNCAPGYSPCIPSYPPDLDCADVNGPVHVTGSDPHGLDADGDGIGCDSG
jgi:endonuclease YncB( thermonuclease family)